MTETDAPAPAPAAARFQLPPARFVVNVDLPTLCGVLVIGTIGVCSIKFQPSIAHDIALAAISGLTGWMGHKVVSGPGQ